MFYSNLLTDSIQYKSKPVLFASANDSVRCLAINHGESLKSKALQVHLKRFWNHAEGQFSRQEERPPGLGETRLTNWLIADCGKKVFYIVEHHSAFEALSTACRQIKPYEASLIGLVRLSVDFLFALACALLFPLKAAFKVKASSQRNTDDRQGEIALLFPEDLAPYLLDD